MGVRIPTYQERQSPSGFGPVPQARVPERATLDGAFDRLGRTFETLGTTISQVNRQNEQALQKKADDDAISSAGKIVSDATLHWDQYLRDAGQQAQTGAAGFTPKVMGEFDDYANKTLSSISNEKARRWAQGHLLSLRTNIGARAIGFEAQAGVAERDANLETTFQNLARLAAQDPGQYDIGRQLLLSTIANAGYDPVVRADRAKRYLERYAEAAMTGAVQVNPEAARSAVDTTAAMRNPAGAGFERAVAFTLRHEGGLNPRDSNGAPAKFGINKAANPDVNLDTLTEQGARDIYRQRYWAAIGGDALAAKNPALAVAAFDTAVIAGPGRANKMLADSGGDPARFMELREQFLADLVRRDPAKFGPYEKAWTARNAGLRSEISGAGAQASPLGRMAGDIDVNRLPQFANAAQTEMNRQQATYRSQITTVENDHVAAWMNGDPVQKPLTEVDYVKAYGPLDGPQRYANYRNVSMMGFDIQQMKLAPDQTVQETLAKYRPQPGAPGYELGLKRFEMMTKAADTILKERRADPMAFAQQNKIGDVKPLDFNDQKAFGAELAKRAGVAATMQQTYGAPLALLSAPEAKVLNEGFQRMTTQQRLAYLETINRAVTDPAAYRAVMQQVAPDSPVTAMAGMILNKQASTRRTSWFSPDQVFASRDVAAIVLEGEALLNPNKASREADGRGREFPMPKEQELRDLFTREVGKAFAGDPNGANFAFQAVKAYYAGQAARDGDITGAIDSSRMKAAVTAVVGGVTDVNGKGEVVRPWGMNEALFKNTVRGKFDEAMAANGYKGTQLDVFDAYGLQSAGDSKYLLRVGTDYLRGRNGSPVLLDLSTPPSAPIPVDPRLQAPPAEPGARTQVGVNAMGNQYGVGVGAVADARSGPVVTQGAQTGTGRTDPVTVTRRAPPGAMPDTGMTVEQELQQGQQALAAARAATPSIPVPAAAAEGAAPGPAPRSSMTANFPDVTRLQARLDQVVANQGPDAEEPAGEFWTGMTSEMAAVARVLAPLRDGVRRYRQEGKTAQAQEQQRIVDQITSVFDSAKQVIDREAATARSFIAERERDLAAARRAKDKDAEKEAQSSIDTWKNHLKLLGRR